MLVIERKQSYFCKRLEAWLKSSTATGGGGVAVQRRQYWVHRVCVEPRGYERFACPLEQTKSFGAKETVVS